MQTRAEDWKAGELSDEYVNKKLQQAEEKLKEYERTAVPQGWACDWNRLVFNIHLQIQLGQPENYCTKNSIFLSLIF